MFKRCQNLGLAVMIALSSSQGFAEPRLKMEIAPEMNEQVKNKVIHGRQELMWQLYSILEGMADSGGNSVFVVGPEGSGRGAVVEAMLIEQEMILSKAQGEQKFIVHAFDMSAAFETANTYSADTRSTDPMTQSTVYETSTRMKEMSPLAQLQEAIDRIEKANINNQNKKPVVNEIHVLKVEINGDTPGVSSKDFTGPFYEALKQAKNRKNVRLIVQMTKELFDQSFAKNSQLARYIEVVPLEEDHLRAAIYEKIKAFNEKQKARGRTEMRFSQQVVEELVRVSNLSKKASNQIFNIDQFLQRLHLEKRIGFQVAQITLEEQERALEAKLKTEKSLEARTKIANDLLEVKLKSYALDLKNTELDEKKVKEMRDKIVVGEEKSGGEKVVGFIKGIVGIKEDGPDVDEQRELRRIRDRVLKAVDEIRDTQGEDVSVRLLHKIAQKEPFFIDKSMLAIDSKNIRATLRKTLNKDIVGLDYFKEQIENAMDRVLDEREGVKDIGTKPMGKFVLFGPTGVGKTASAKSLASAMGAEIVRINGNVIKQSTSVTGAEPSFVGFDKPTPWQPILDNPNKRFVVILDEIDKIPMDVLETLMTALDEGIMDLGNGQKAILKNCVIMMTTNWGQELFRLQYMSPEWVRYVTEVLELNVDDFRNLKRTEIEQKVLNKYLTKVAKMKEELAGRIGRYLMMRRLSSVDAKKITTKMLLDLQESYSERGIKIAFSEETVLRIYETYDPNRGARGLEHEIEMLREKIIKTVSEATEKQGIARRDFYQKNALVVSVGAIENMFDSGPSKSIIGYTEADVHIVSREDFKAVQKETVLLADKIDHAIEQFKAKIGSAEAAERGDIIKNQMNREERLRLAIDEYATQRFIDREKPKVYGEVFLTKEMVQKYMARSIKGRK